MKDKPVSFEQFEAAIEASYELGLIDGNKAPCHPAVKKVRIKMGRLLICNKALGRILAEEHTQERKGIFITPAFGRTIFRILKLNLNSTHPDYHIVNYFGKKLNTFIKFKSAEGQMHDSTPVILNNRKENNIELSAL